MSIIDTLIIDRTQADAELARRLGATGWAAMTDEQRALYLSDQLKGAYKASDLNRVNAAMDYLVGRLKAQGINVPIKRSKIPHKQSGGKRLPEGHNELKWIESTGTQYVDTDVVGKSGLKFVLNVAWTDLSQTDTIFGCLGNNQRIFVQYDKKEGFLYAYKDWYSTNFSRVVNQPYEIVADFSLGNQSMTINGVNYYTGTDNTIVATGLNVFLFTLNYIGNPSGYSRSKLYSCQIYDNGTLVRDYIPDMLDSGEVGLYDMVEGKFYPNAGAGVFLAGPRRVELPEGFTQVEWIESHGEEYVDTLFKPKYNTRVVADISDATTEDCIFGARDTDSSTAANQFVVYITAASAIRSDYFGTSVSKTPGNIAERTIVDKNANITTAYGLTITNTAVSSGAVTHSLYLFAMNTAGTVKVPSSLKLHFCKILDVNLLARDYIPCITAEGEGGLYDLVTNEFYGNAGSGAFTYGEIVEWEPLPDVEVLDDYTWYDSDVPTAALLTEHLSNVGSVRSALRAALPEIPADMDDGLTMAEANNIELVLVNMEQLINNMMAAYRHCGVTVCGMGGLIL